MAARRSEQANARAGGRALMAISVLVVLTGLVLVLDPDRIYQWVKVLHILAVISWMAGLLYLPRLFINHLEVPSGSEADHLFQGMERRLMKIIMTPAMILSWLAGLSLAQMGSLWAEPWFWIKVLAVICMTATHMWFASSIKAVAGGRSVYTGRQWRMINEIPTLLMVVIVVMVVVRPF